jgi:hypothetical protein
MASLSATATAAERTERLLIANARLLSQLAEFRRRATSKTLFLAALTCAIDDETTLVSLQLEPSGGTLSAITPNPASLLGKLESIPGLASPAIVGSVTPDAPSPAVAPGPPPTTNTESSEPMNRVTVHFEWRDVRVPTPTSRCDS